MDKFHIVLLVMAFLLLIIELITKRGLLIWFAVGMLATALATLFATKITILIAVFIGSSLLLYILLDKWYKTYILPARKYEEEIPQNLVDSIGVVIKPVKSIPHVSGKVEINNVLYTAVTKEAEIDIDTKVIVTSVDDTKIHVKRK